MAMCKEFFCDFICEIILYRTGEEASKEAEAKRIRKEEKAQKKKDSKKDEGEWTDVVKGAPHVIVSFMYSVLKSFYISFAKHTY